MKSRGLDNNWGRNIQVPKTHITTRNRTWATNHLVGAYKLVTGNLSEVIHAIYTSSSQNSCSTGVTVGFWGKLKSTLLLSSATTGRLVSGRLHFDWQLGRQADTKEKTSILLSLVEVVAKMPLQWWSFSLSSSSSSCRSSCFIQLGVEHYYW